MKKIGRNGAAEPRKEKSSSFSAIAVLDAAPANIYVVDADGFVVYANAAALMALGYAKHELVGSSIHSLVHCPEGDEHRLCRGDCASCAAISDHEQDVIEQTFYRRHAQSFVAECSLSRMMFEDGTIGAIVTFRDVSSDNRRERILDGLLREMPEPLIFCDNERKILFCNPAFTREFGYSEKAVVGRTTEFLYPSKEAFEARGKERFQLTAKQRREPYEQTYKRSDGTLFAGETVGSMLTDGNGESLGFFGHIRDITERKRLEEVKAEFVATISHELRTPVTSIYGSLRLLNSGVAGDLPKSALKMVGLAARNSERLLKLVNEILDIEKLETGRMELSLAPFAVSEILPEVVYQNQAFGDLHNVELTLGCIQNGTIILDRQRFVQVLANLISNAVKFSPPKTSVIVESIMKERSVRFQVTDKGPGIPPEFQPRLFEKFTQAAKSLNRGTGGSGLGLAIAKSFVEAMGGRIGFETRLGEGTCFWVEFPCVSQNTMVA